MKPKVAAILNIIISILALTGMIMMLLGIQFMGPEDGFSDDKLSMFRFYTVDSNVLMGIISGVFALFETKIIKNKLTEISNKLYILKLISTVGVSLTLTVVVFYLAPIARYGYFSMFRNANLFFHLLVPVLSIIVFCFFEETDKIKFKHTFTGMSSMILYTMFYTTNVLIHMENGKVSPIYDWYWFVQQGVWTMVIILPIILTITYIISFTLWKLNKAEQK